MKKIILCLVILFQFAHLPGQSNPCVSLPNGMDKSVKSIDFNDATFSTDVDLTIPGKLNEGDEVDNVEKGEKFVSTFAESHAGTTGINKSLIADPAPPGSITITVTTVPTAGGTITGDGTFSFNPATGVATDTYDNHDNGERTIVAVPKPGYKFAYWTFAGTATRFDFGVTPSDSKLIFHPKDLFKEYDSQLKLEAHFVLIDTYTITANVDSKSHGTITGTTLFNFDPGTGKGYGDYTVGSVITLTAIPLPGFAFDKWTEIDDRGREKDYASTASTTVTVNDNRTFQAYFIKVNQFTITATPTPAAGGSTTGSGTYNDHTNVTVTATPATGYTFNNWTRISRRGNERFYSNSITFLYTDNRDITLHANFDVSKQYTITATPSPAAGGSTTGSGTYYDGTLVTLTATPAAGYDFVNWTEGGTIRSTMLTCAVTADQDRTLVANFKLKTYSINASVLPAGGGTVTDGVTGPAPTFFKTVSHGNSVTLTAAPTAGYAFVSWSEGGVTVSNVAAFTFVATQDRTLVANFIPRFTITATPTPAAGGTTTGSGIYDSGTTVPLTAAPVAGYKFVNWTEGGIPYSTNSSISVTADKNRTLLANFIKQYTITATLNPATGGSTAGSGIYDNGASVTLTATPVAGYRLVNWTEGGAPVSTNSTITITADKDRTLVANFIQQFTITATPTPAAGGSTTGSGIYDNGATATLTATPVAGYKFVNWTDGGTVVSTNPNVSITADKDRTLLANFVRQFIVTATPTPAAGGTTSGTGTYNIGATVPLTATPASGWAFVNWTEGGTIASNNPSISVTADKDRTLLANFIQQFTITATPTPAVGGSTTGSGTYVIGTTVTLTATPLAGYKFVNWTEGGVVVSTNPVISTTADKDRTLLANFIQQFNITATPTPAVGGSTSGSGTYDSGATVSLTATPAPGYAFGNWTEGGVVFSSNPAISVTADKNRLLLANFIQQFTVTASPTPAVGGSTTGSGIYNSGTTVPLTATPAPGYIFVNWTEGGTIVSTNPNITTTADQNRLILANFIQQFTVTATPTPAVGGSTTGSGVYNSGTTVPLTATAAPGYIFVNWTEGGTIASTNPAISVTADKNRTLLANFIQQFTITASPTPAVGGSTTGSGTYNAGTNVTLTATPAPGYTFANWTEGGTIVSTNAAISVTADKDRTLLANFIQRFTVTATPNPAVGGSTTGSGVYDIGTTVSLGATPAPGYAFVNWTEGGTIVSSNPGVTVTADKDRTLLANFIQQFTITASPTPAAGGSTTGSGAYNIGSDVPLSAIPAPGYTFVNWTEGGVIVSTNPGISVKADQNRTLLANFIERFTITATPSPAVGGSTSGTGIYDSGSAVTLTAYPVAGYRFVNWTEGGTIVSANSSISFTADKDRTLVANFIQRFTITATPSPAIGGSTSGSGIFDSGATATLTATPVAGYKFVNWTEAGVEVSATSTISVTVDKDKTLVANFIQQFTITATPSPAAGGATTGSGIYDTGTTATLTATPAAGYKFVNWTEGGTPFSTNSSISVTADKDRTLVANFIKQFTITATPNSAANGSTTGSGIYDAGTTVSLTATPLAGYEFVNWSEGGTDVSGSATLSFIASGDRTLVANFKLKTYTIKANVLPAGGGTVTDGTLPAAPSLTKTFTHGDGVTLTATPAAGYDFVNWTEAGVEVSKATDFNFTATGDRTLVANFKIKTYTVTATVQPTGGGTISGTAPFSYDATGGTGSSIYNYNDNVTLTAAPVAGYSFVNWTEGATVVSGSESLTFFATGNRNLVANFTKDSYTITASILPVMGGTISANGSPAGNAITGVYSFGNNVTLSTTPATGYTFVNWTEAGVEVSNSATYSFTATGDRTLVANVIRKQYTITATANPTDGGTISVTGAGPGTSTFTATYSYGDNVMITATPAAGSEFINWTEGGIPVSANANLVFNASANRTLVANFRKAIYTITLNANPVAGGTVSGGGMFADQTNITVTATPAAGYSFENWSEGGSTVSSSAGYNFTVGKNRNLTANFKKLDEYIITTYASPPEGGTITGDGGYFSGTTAKLIATPAKGYAFVKWTEAGSTVSTDSLFSFTVVGNRTLTAVFQKRTFTLTASANPTAGGTITGTGITTGNGTSTASGTYIFGDSVTLTATPASSGEYTFVNWSDDGNMVSTKITYTFSVSKNHHLLANFKKSNEFFITTIISPPEGGSAIGGGGYYYKDTYATLTTSPSKGYVFVSWTENGRIVKDSLGNPAGETYKFLVTKDSTFTANFKPMDFTVKASASPSGGGSITGTLPFSFDTPTGTGIGGYKYGDNVTLTAAPATGFVFVKWTEKDGSTVNDAFGTPATARYSFTVEKSRDIIAVFNRKAYQIKAISNPTEGGAIAKTGTLTGTTSFAASYNHGDTVKLSATPSPGYEFINWTKDSTVVSNSATFGFIAIQDSSFVANFKIKSFIVKAATTPSEGGTITGTAPFIFNPITGTGSGEFKYGDNVKLSATAATGYAFVNWTEDSTVLNIPTNDYAFYVDKTREIKANFIKKTYLIKAISNPTGGGTIAKTGTLTGTTSFVATYTHGDTVKLTATPSPGYEFVNWTNKDSIIVSDIAVFNFIPSHDSTFVANFKLKSFIVKASVFPAVGGIITGTGAFTFISPSGSGNYNYGDNVKLSAIPAQGYAFVNWTEDSTTLNVSSSDNAFIVEKNRDIRANFIRKTCLIKATANPYGGGTVTDGVESAAPTISKTFAHGDTVKLSATPSPGYEFVSWTKDSTVVSNTAVFIFSAIQDSALVANFKLKSFNIKATTFPTEGGTITGTGSFTFISPTGSGNYNYGDNVTLSASAAPGFEFVNWTEDGTVLNVSTPDYAFIVDKNRNIKANFIKKTYLVTASAQPTEGGTIKDSIESAAPTFIKTFKGGDYVTLHAAPSTRYNFVNWTEGVDEVFDTVDYSFTVTGDRILVANFKLKSFKVKASVFPIEGGVITGTTPFAFIPISGIGLGEYNYGDNVKLSAIAAPGYEFVNWTEDGTVLNVSSLDFDFTIDKDRNIRANFIKKTYSVKATAKPSDGGTITDGIESAAPGFCKTFCHGENVNLKAAPSPGYEFISWTDQDGLTINDSSGITVGAEYSFKVEKDRTLTANFIKNTYSIKATANSTAGGIITDGAVSAASNYFKTFAFGDNVKLSVTAAPGYEFVNWTEDGTALNVSTSDYTFIVENNRDIRANFIKKTYLIKATSKPAEGGSVTDGVESAAPTFSKTFAHGDTVKFSAIPSPGYEFVSWTKDSTIVSNTATFSFAVTQDGRLVANFKLKSFIVKATAVPTNGGTITGTGTFTFISPSGFGNYTYGDSVKLSATAATGYEFVNWTEDSTALNVSSPDYVFFVDKNRNIRANFIRKTYLIKASTNPAEGGSVTDGAESAAPSFSKTFAHGDTVRLSAIPSPGYEFVSWTKDSTIVSNTPTFIYSVIQNCTLVANFKFNSFIIKATTSPTKGGTITGTTPFIYTPVTGSGSGYFKANVNVKLSATAAPGYEFVNWTEESTALNVSNTDYSFIVDKNRDIKANFIRKTYLIKATSNPTEGGSVTDGVESAAPTFSKTFAHGDTVRLSAIPSPGYEFVSWIKDSTVVSNTATFSFFATQDSKLVANFKLKSLIVNATTSPTKGGTITGTTPFIFNTLTGTGSGDFKYGDNVILSSIAATGYEFVNWTEDGTVLNVSTLDYAFIVDKNRDIRANFIKKSYLIKATSNPAEGGSVTDGVESAAPIFSKTFAHGDTVRLSAIPSPGYVFVSWTKDSTVVSKIATFNFAATQDGTLVANFKLKSYIVIAATSPAKSGTINGTFPFTFKTSTGSGSGDFKAGVNVKLSVTAVTGYEFVNWTEDSTSLNVSTSDYAFIVDKNRDIRANFIKKTYLIKATANPAKGGSVTDGVESAAPTFGKTFAHGDTVKLSASPSPGYEFVNWTKDSTVLSNTATFSFAATQDGTLMANFRLKFFIIKATTAPSNGGTITGNGTFTFISPSGYGNFKYGDTVKLSTIAAPGFEFVNWTEDGTALNVSTSDYTFIVDKNRDIRANFIKKTYLIKATSNPAEGGSVTDGVESAAPTFSKTFAHGDTVKLSAIPSPGYEFVSWTKDSTIVSNTATFSFAVTQDGRLVANFKLKSFIVKATAVPTNGGTITGTGTFTFISPSGSGNYTYGDTVKLSATAATGYEFVNWTEDSTALNVSSPDYVFFVDKNRDIRANFIRKTYLIKAFSNPAEGGSVTDGVERTTPTFSKTISHGDSITLSAIPEPCFEFENWSENNVIVSLTANYILIATANRTLTANFKGPSPLRIISSDSVCMSEVINFEVTADKALTNQIWDFGDGTSSIGPVTSHVYAVNGQYTVTVKALIGTLCHVSASKIITVNSNLLDLNLKDISGCTPFRIALAPSSKEKLLWNFGDDNNWYPKGEKIYVNNTDYPMQRKVTIVSVNDKGCNITTSFNVTINPNPQSAIESYTIPGRPELLVLKNKSILADSCDWELSDGTHKINNDSVVEQFKESGLYRILLKTSNKYGCIDTTSITHRTIFAGLFIPNAFRPESSDPKVNTFKAIGLGIKFFYMGIYDLWGNLIWQTKAEGNLESFEGWNGKSQNGTPLPDGVYIWRVKAIFVDGTEWKGNRDGKGFYRTEGNVTLLR